MHEKLNVLIDYLSKDLKEDNKREFYSAQYALNKDGEYINNKFSFSSKEYFSLTGTIDKDIGI